MAISGVNARALELAKALLARFLVANADRRRLQGGSAFGPSSEEVAVTLRGGAGEPDAEAEQARVREATEAFTRGLAEEPESAFARLVRVAHLSSLDASVLAVLLAPELDHELERAFTFALDDFTRKRIDLGFLARLGGESVLARLDEAAPLRRSGTVVVGAAQENQPASLRVVRVADRIVAYLRGLDTIDESVRDVVRVTTGTALDRIVIAPDVVAQIRRALAVSQPRVLLAGPEGTGKALVAESLAGGAVRIDLAGIAAEPRIGERLAAALREAALRGKLAILDGGSALKDDVPRALVQAVADSTAAVAVPIVLTLTTRPSWVAQAVDHLLEIEVPPPSFRERLELWRRLLPPPLAKPEDLEAVAARYAFTGAVISRVAMRAFASTKLRDVTTLSLDDLGDAARVMFSHRLGTMAQRIPTGFSWDDLVLPKDTLDAVREVVRFARYRPVLLEDWGFAAKLPYGRGVSAIMAGPPGTGKTMVAQLLAHELGYDLYRVDLSQVVNKYIGETEKNLARIFEEAEHSHAVLFFDEADSLFAKRTEVKSSNDRYANLEVNYLLQRMETFDGVTLLATNLEQGLDDAFKRRVRFSIAFELPEESERVRLWKSMFPPAAPLAPDIDWDQLGHKFVMAGGYIKKAVVRAATIAAEGNRAVTTADLLEAARAEYREMGRVI